MMDMISLPECWLYFMVAMTRMVPERKTGSVYLAFLLWPHLRLVRAAMKKNMARVNLVYFLSSGRV